MIYYENIPTKIPNFDLSKKVRYENDNGYGLRLQKEDLDPLYKDLLSGIVKYTNGRKFNLHVAWLNIHNFNDFAQPHDHHNVDFTSIYYLKVPSDCGSLYINESLNKFPMIRQYFPKLYDLIVIHGEYVHKTDVNKSKEPRISLICDWLYENGKNGENIINHTMNKPDLF